MRSSCACARSGGLCRPQREVAQTSLIKMNQYLSSRPEDLIVALRHHFSLVQKIVLVESPSWFPLKNQKENLQKRDEDKLQETKNKDYKNSLLRFFFGKCVVRVWLAHDHFVPLTT